MFNLTKEECKVVLFLIMTAFTGLAINLLIKLNTPIKILSCYQQDIGKIDLNSANQDLLTSVPGIGVKLASRILSRRNESGVFKELEELKEIQGITNYKYEKIKNSFFIKQ
jgi:competence ComEA-like helix-hairpin-helix protein